MLRPRPIKRNRPDQPRRPASEPASASPDGFRGLPSTRKNEKPDCPDSCAAWGVGGTAPDQREGRECISPRSPDSPFHLPASSALTCPTVPAGGLDSGNESPVCDRLSRKSEPLESPPLRFQTFRESWIWRPGLGIRSIASLLWPLSCTLSTSYTNLVCMSCKVESCKFHLPPFRLG